MAGKNLKPIREARKQGFSTVISVTGFCEAGKRYRIEKMDIQGEWRIVLTDIGKSPLQIGKKEFLDMNTWHEAKNLNEVLENDAIPHGIPGILTTKNKDGKKFLAELKEKGKAEVQIGFNAYSGMFFRAEKTNSGYRFGIFETKVVK